MQDPMTDKALRTLRLKAARWQRNQAEVRRLQKALTDVGHHTPGLRRDELGAAYAIAEAKNREVLSARACASATAYYLYLIDRAP